MEVFLKGITYLINKINWTSFQCVFGLSVIIMKIHYCIHNNEKWAGCLFAFWRGHPPTPTCLALGCCAPWVVLVWQSVIYEKQKASSSLVLREWSQQSLGFRPQAWPLLQPLWWWCIPGSCALGAMWPLCAVMRISELVGAQHSWCGTPSAEEPWGCGGPGYRYMLNEHFLKMCFSGF